LILDSPSKPPLVSTPQSNVDLGTIVFTGFSVVSLVVSLAKGVVPIYLGEAVLWGVIAWFWHKRKPDSQASTVTLLLLAVAVAAGEGYLVGTQSSDNHRQTEQTGAPATLPPGFVFDKEPARKVIGQEAAAVPPASQGDSVSSPQTEQKRAVQPLPRQVVAPKPVPQSSCSDPLAPGEDRTPVALHGSELALVNTSLEAADVDSLFLDARNGSNYCITSIAISLTIESDWAKMDKIVNQTLSFSPAIAPGQTEHKNVRNVIYYDGGGVEHVSGLLKRWNITEVRGFPAPSKHPL
jgi:hypothetical protein